MSEPAPIWVTGTELALSFEPASEIFPLLRRKDGKVFWVLRKEGDRALLQERVRPWEIVI